MSLLLLYGNNLVSLYCYIITFIVIVTVYYPSNLVDINIKQLTLGLRKLIGETTSVIWVDLEYKLRSRNTVPVQCSGGCPTSCIVHIVIVIDYLAVGLGSVPGDWAVVPGMYGTPLKYGQCLLLSVSVTLDPD